MTFYLIPDGKGEDHDDVIKIPMCTQLGPLGDSNPEKIKDVGGYTLQGKGGIDDTVILNKTGYSLKFGASYEFLVQGGEIENGSELMTVKVLYIYC